MIPRRFRTVTLGREVCSTFLPAMQEAVTGYGLSAHPQLQGSTAGIATYLSRNLIRVRMLNIGAKQASSVSDPVDLTVNER